MEVFRSAILQVRQRNLRGLIVLALIGASVVRRHLIGDALSEKQQLFAEGREPVPANHLPPTRTIAIIVTLLSCDRAEEVQDETHEKTEGYNPGVPLPGIGERRGDSG